MKTGISNEIYGMIESINKDKYKSLEINNIVETVEVNIYRLNITRGDRMKKVYLLIFSILIALNIIGGIFFYVQDHKQEIKLDMKYYNMKH